jgi:hypothetical protein
LSLTAAKKNLRGLAVGGETAQSRHHAEGVRQRRRAALQVVECLERELVLESAGVVAPRLCGDRDELLGLRDVERTQRQVNQAEQGGVRPEANREREHRRGGERLVRGEEPQRVAKMHHRSTTAICSCSARSPVD